MLRRKEGGNEVMRLKEGADLAAFIRKVKTCEYDVFLKTQEGDQLNLKSALSQYVFVVLAERQEILRNSEIACSPEDKEKIEEFLILP